MTWKNDGWEPPKPQPVFEFLMTWGWLILVLMAAVCAMIYFFSGENICSEFTAPALNGDVCHQYSSFKGNNDLYECQSGNAYHDVRDVTERRVTCR